MNGKSLLLLFSLLLLSVTGALAQSLEGLTVALSVESSQPKVRQAFSAAVAKHLRQTHGLRVVDAAAPADILVRLSVVVLEQDGE